MKKINAMVIACLAAAVLTGCSKSGSDQAVAPLLNPPAQPQIPTQAQPKLPTIKIYIGSAGPSGSPRAAVDAEMALTPQEEATGLMFRTNIPEDDSMLFVLPYPQAASFWMTNCPVSESAAYISSDGMIEEIHHFEKNDPTPVVATHPDIQFVLETADGWYTRHGVNEGMVITTEKGTLAQTFLNH